MKRLSIAGFAPPSVYIIFRLSVLPKNVQNIFLRCPGRQDGQLSSSRNDLSASRPARHRPARRSAVFRPAPARLDPPVVSPGLKFDSLYKVYNVGAIEEASRTIIYIVSKSKWKVTSLPNRSAPPYIAPIPSCLASRPDLPSRTRSIQIRSRIRPVVGSSFGFDKLQKFIMFVLSKKHPEQYVSMFVRARIERSSSCRITPRRLASFPPRSAFSFTSYPVRFAPTLLTPLRSALPRRARTAPPHAARRIFGFYFLKN